MNRDLIARFERQRIPRYTSYPTAPHFTPAVDEAAYAAWLAAMPPTTRLSLYLHVPFCRSMCWYCGCHTKITRADDPILAYLDALRQEIGLVAALLPPGMTVGHVHWGGGTPTIMPAAEFVGLMDRLRATFAFAPDAEVAVEIDPRRLSADVIAALADAGVDRASLGVQTFDPEVQRAINRIQTFEQTRAASEGLRAAGIAGINFDLIYGLPHQTTASCADTVERAAALAPDRFAVFGYAHVPWMKTHQKMIDAAALPGGVERVAQFQAIAGRLAAFGYDRIGLDHFALRSDPLAAAARSGTLRRNFQGYTTDACDVLIGFGASAIGALPQGYVQNETAIGEYRRRVAAGRLAARRGIALTDADRLRRAIIEAIMCLAPVDLAAAAQRPGAPADGFAAEIAALSALEQDGLVRLDGGVLAVVPGNALFVRSVAAVFDAWLAPEATRHAAAV